MPLSCQVLHQEELTGGYGGSPPGSPSVQFPAELSLGAVFQRRGRTAYPVSHRDMENPRRKCHGGENPTNLSCGLSLGSHGCYAHPPWFLIQHNMTSG